MSAEALAMSAPMTAAEHIEAGQISFDEMLAGQGETRSLFNSLITSRPGKLLTRLAISAGAFAGGGEGVVGIASASAQGNSGGAIAANVFDWSNVGGDPLVPGGIHSVGAAKAFLESGPGRAALSRQGLNGADAAAVEKAVRANPTKLHDCTIPADTIIPVMVSGKGEVTFNNVLDDPSDPNGVPGFCVTATRTFMQGHKKFTKTINEGIAGPCGNALLLGENEQSVNVPKPKKAKVEVFKIALDDTGRQLVDNNGHAIDPTGTFRFEATCEDGSQEVSTRATYNESPEPLIECNVGTKVTVEELSTFGPEQWDQLSPGTQSQIVGRNGNEFVYKDEETAPATPAPVTIPGPPGPQGPPGTPTTPQTPGISIQKSFVASYNSDGSLYSNIATKHGDTDEWQIVVKNTGTDTLNDQYTDTPPEGEVNINNAEANPAQPFGFQVDGNGIGYFTDVTSTGAEEVYTVYTENVDVPCFTNVVNTIGVVGTDIYGNHVTATAQAYTKEENTGPDCIDEAPPITGPGQPLSTS